MGSWKGFFHSLSSQDRKMDRARSMQTETFWRFTDGESSLLALMRFWMLNTGNSSYIWLLCVCLILSLFSWLINPLCLNPNKGIILPLLYIIKDTGENLIASDPTNSQIVISTRPESKNNEISKWIESTGWRCITQPAKVNCFKLLRCFHCITAPRSLTQPVSLTVLCHVEQACLEGSGDQCSEHLLSAELFPMFLPPLGMPSHTTRLCPPGLLLCMASPEHFKVLFLQIKPLVNIFRKNMPSGFMLCSLRSSGDGVILERNGNIGT